MPQKHSFPLLYFPDWTVEMLCSQVFRNTFWTDCREFRMPLLDSQSKLQNQTILLPFCTNSTGYQCLIEYNTKYSPSVTVPCQILVLDTCPKSCKLIHNQDNSVRPVTTAFFVYSLSKQKPLVKDSFYMQALRSSTNFHMLISILPVHSPAFFQNSLSPDFSSVGCG